MHRLTDIMEHDDEVTVVMFRVAIRQAEESNVTHSANNVLRLMGTCVHCGQSTRLVRLDDELAWTHDYSGYYTCSINTFIMSGKPWREYVSDGKSPLAEVGGRGK